MSRVTVVHWNPWRRPADLLRRPSRPMRVGNFGDLLGPRLVREILRRRGMSERAPAPARLLTIGSIMALARTGDVVWGTGVNGKSAGRDLSGRDLDIRAVRGPLTRDVLHRNGYQVPDVYGDPALLWGRLWSREELARAWPGHRELVVPNLHDVATVRTDTTVAGLARRGDVLDPRRPVAEVIGRIAASEFVVGSSLHAVIVAESLGVPARLVRSAVEPEFKYLDYYLGSGRGGFRAGRTVSQALEMGPEPAPAWRSGPLLRSFPADLWGAGIPAPSAPRLVPGGGR